MPLNIDIQQILLHMLNFVILFAALWFLLYKPVKKFMDDREASYKKASDEAGEKMKKADDALAGLDGALEEKKKQAEAERTALLASAQTACKEKLDEAEKRAEQIVSDARAEAEAIRKKAVSQSSRDISELAVESVEKAVMASAEEAFETFLNTVEKEQNHE